MSVCYIYSSLFYKFCSNHTRFLRIFKNLNLIYLLKFLTAFQMLYFLTGFSGSPKHRGMLQIRTQISDMNQHNILMIKRFLFCDVDVNCDKLHHQYAVHFQIFTIFRFFRALSGGTMMPLRQKFQLPQ